MPEPGHERLPASQRLRPPVTILSCGKPRQDYWSADLHFDSLGEFKKMRRAVMLLSIGLMLLPAGVAFAQNNRPHNIILFVPDGLRGRIVSAATAPAMAEVRDRGVNFKNSHSMFPAFTTANASAMATGH